RPATGSLWADLAKTTLICLPPDSPIQQLINRHLATRGGMPTERTQVNQLETAVMMAEAGFGVAVIPSFAASVCDRYAVDVHALQPLAACDFCAISRTERENPEHLQFFSR